MILNWFLGLYKDLIIDKSRVLNYNLVEFKLYQALCALSSAWLEHQAYTLGVHGSNP